MQENCNLLITGPLIIFIKFAREYFDFNSIRSEIEWKRDIFDPLSVLKPTFFRNLWRGAYRIRLRSVLVLINLNFYKIKLIFYDSYHFSNGQDQLQRNSELPDEWSAVQKS